MTGNIVGEPIVEAIDKQIDYRQQIHGAGYIPGTQNLQRTPEVQNYLNNRNSWIKMASGVSLSGSAAVDKIKALSNDSSNYLTDEDIEAMQGEGLAKSVVLFNGIQKFNSAEFGYFKPNAGFQHVTVGDDGEAKKIQISKSSHNKRSGVASSYSFLGNSNKMYGGLGSSQRGLQPVPGIIDMSVECVNRGSIRKATIKLKAYNKFQFGLIELLYLRLGHSVMLEWGWDKYIDKITPSDNATTPPTVKIKEMESTIIENQWFDGKDYSQSNIIDLISAYEERFKGNYGGFFGIVSNFSWTLNPDNTYDITLNLITVGSVVESLNIKIPTNNISSQALLLNQQALNKILKLNLNIDTFDDSDNIFLSNLGSDKLSQWVSTTIINFSKLNDAWLMRKNYIIGQNLISTPDLKQNYLNSIGVAENYFVRFETFLTFIQDVLICDVINGEEEDKELEFELDPGLSRCNYETNLVPLSPNKVIFSVLMDKKVEDRMIYATPTQGSKGKGERMSPIQHMNNAMEEFAAEKDNVVYGNLLNCYLNLTFIQQSFIDAQNDKEEVSLFEFLQKICDGINESTGNCTDLEVVLKNDKTVVIIDQNQIKGGDNLIKNFEEKTEINVYGYEPKGSSSFVKDFKFQTKITPNLMNMISIGATASDEKDINAIPFQEWNRGLNNRFGSIQKYEEDDQQTIDDRSNKEFKDAFSKAIGNGDANYDNGDGYKWKYGDIKITRVWAEGISWDSDNDKDKNNEALLSQGLKKYKRALRKYNTVRKIGNPKSNILRSKAEAENNYMVYLAAAFGGTSGFLEEFTTANGDISFKDTGTYASSTNINTSNYFKWGNKDFIQQGKNSFKNYLANINKEEAIATIPIISGTGFIPLELSITMDGLSGIKIYNRLKINTKFLPSSYPKTLKFIVKGVDHKVSNNVWDTNISTISVPVSKNIPKKRAKGTLLGALLVYGIKKIIEYVTGEKEIKTFFPEIPLIQVPPATSLSYEEAVQILKGLTNKSIAKAVFAIMFAESTKKDEKFISPGGYNYSGTQTDNGRWGTGSQYITARYVREDAQKPREFAVFSNNTEFLKFMVDRIDSRAVNGENAISWTRSYIDTWWSPEQPDKEQILKQTDVLMTLNYLRRKNNTFPTGKEVFNGKKSIYNSAMKRFDKFEGEYWPVYTK